MAKASPQSAKGGRSKEPEPSQPPTQPILHAGVYEELRHRMITGKIVPGVRLSTRALAMEMGVSQMPVRQAFRRLAADGAVHIRSKRRLEVSPMTAARFRDLLHCRLLLEPQAAVLALPNLTPALLKKLREIDAAVDLAKQTGDLFGYLEGNFHFHFSIYRANNRPTLNRLIESLWLQVGPFMRVVYARCGTANLLDQHRPATDSIEARDATALRQAIASDIRDGMGLIGERSGPTSFSRRGPGACTPARAALQ